MTTKDSTSEAMAVDAGDERSVLEHSLTFLILRLVISCLAIPGNAIIVLTILRSPRMCARAYNILIAQLAASDMIIGIGLFVRVVATSVQKLHPLEEYTEVYCVSVASISVFGIQLSQLSILLIAVDRLTAIRSPVSYKNKDPFWYPIRCIITTTFVASFGVLLLYMRVDPGNSLPICTLSASDIHSFAGYWVAFSFSVCTTIFTSYGYTIYLLHSNSEIQRKAESSREFARQKRVFLTISVVLVSYFLCYVVPLIALIVGFIVEASDEVLSLTVLIFGVASGVNSASNILLYGWKYKELRISMIKLIKGELRSGGAAVVRKTSSMKRRTTTQTTSNSSLIDRRMTLVFQEEGDVLL